MKVIIVEDEKVAAEKLERLILEINPSVEILARIGSIKEAKKWFLQNKADLIFLDIQLSDGISFSIFENLDVNTPVIFTTAYDQYAIKAFNLNSIAYLLKPIRKKELEESLRKYEKLKSSYAIDFETLLADLEGRKPNYKKRFMMQIGERWQKVEVKRIAFFYAMEKAVFCKTFDNEHYPLDYSLEKLHELLNPEYFFRINRKYIINIDSIKKMIAWSRSRIKLELNPEAPNAETIVSVERSSEFKQWMDR